MIKCSRCKESLPDDSFCPSQRADGKWCKECNIAYNKRPEQKQKKRDQERRRAYKLTKKELTDFKNQKTCANSGCNNPAEDIDHCHSSGKVRGMLCHKCNTALGFLGDNPDKIAGLLEYLLAKA